MPRILFESCSVKRGTITVGETYAECPCDDKGRYDGEFHCPRSQLTFCAPLYQWVWTAKTPQVKYSCLNPRSQIAHFVIEIERSMRVLILS